jgi:hypothetical protein
MAVPTQYTNHVTDGLAHFTDGFKDPLKVPILQGLTSVYLRQIQYLENVVWQIVLGRMLANTPTGDMLTQLGKLVGQPRGSYNDANLLVAVELRIMANRSNGTAPDILAMAVALSPLWAYWEVHPMGFAVGLWNIASPDLAQDVLTEAKPGGYYGLVVYTTWSDGNDFGFTSHYDSTQGEAGFGSIYDSGVSGGLLASARAL